MAVLEICCLMAVIAILAYIYITRNHNYWEKRGIPYEKAVPFFGNMFDAYVARRNQGQIIADVYRKFEGEKVVGMFNAMNPALLIRDPELINQVLVTDFHSFANNSVEVDETIEPTLARNMFVQKGERWKRTRQAMSPAFTWAKIKPTFETMRAVVEKFVKWVEEHPEEEVKYSLSLYTSEIVASWGIGIDGHSFDEESPILQKLGKLIFDPDGALSLKFLLMSASPRTFKLLRLKFLPDEVPNFFDVMLRQLIKSRKMSSEHRHDFLQYYIDLHNKRSQGKNDDQDDISEDDIIAGVVSFFMEGYETSSIISSFVVFSLVNERHVQSKLQREVDEMFEKSNEKPSLDDILSLPYLNRVFSETIRIYGGALNMAKDCTQPIDLDIGKGKRLHVDVGTTILISMYGVQNDPKYWKDPEKFDPDRHTEEAKAERTKGTYIPFGDGPRICVGYRMALAVVKTAIVYIVRNFDILPTGKTAKTFIQDPKHFTSLQKGGIYVKFQKRKH